MVEVSFFARRAKLTIEETLLKMREAGVDSLPGGGAEIFARQSAIYYLRPQDRRSGMARYGAIGTPAWLQIECDDALRPH